MDQNLVAYAKYSDKRFERLEDLSGKIISIITAPQIKARKEEARQKHMAEENRYGHAFNFVENVNYWIDEITGEPKKTEVTSIYKACRFLGEEDLLFSVLTDMPGVSLAEGLVAGYMNSKLDYGLLTDGDGKLLSSLANVKYHWKEDKKDDDENKELGKIRELLENDISNRKNQIRETGEAIERNYVEAVRYHIGEEQREGAHVRYEYNLPEFD